MSLSLSDLEAKALNLHALTQGADVIYNEIEATTSPASNAMVAMLETITKEADELLRMIGEMDFERNEARAANAM